jgi:hypothetical protein
MTKRTDVKKPAGNNAFAKCGAGHWNFSTSNIASSVLGLDHSSINLIDIFNIALFN